MCRITCSFAKLSSCVSKFQQLILSSVLKPASYDDRIFSIHSPKVALIFNLGTKHVAIYALFFLKVKLRDASKKNYWIIWELFPTWGGGLPNSRNPKPKKVPLNHPKITQKTN